MRRRDRRLLGEALEFLRKSEGALDPENALKALFAFYKEIDTYADCIRPGEREFFPKRRRERTLERFLEGFKYIFYILRNAEDRLYLANVFRNFWRDCTVYLNKCGYSQKFITETCGEGSLFYRHSFNFWRREFNDSEEGLLVMYAYFRACFGIEGNDEYCMVDLKREVTYDGRRMRACQEKLHELDTRDSDELVPPVYEEWSDRNTKLLREVVARIRGEINDEREGALAVLEDIRKRNRQAEPAAKRVLGSDVAGMD